MLLYNPIWRKLYKSNPTNQISAYYPRPHGYKNRTHVYPNKWMIFSTTLPYIDLTTTQESFFFNFFQSFFPYFHPFLIPFLAFSKPPSKIDQYITKKCINLIKLVLSLLKPISALTQRPTLNKSHTKFIPSRYTTW
jgi:hypothetical protein